MMPTNTIKALAALSLASGLAVGLANPAFSSRQCRRISHTVYDAYTGQYTPPWTRGGDREFNGHGPRVEVSTSLSTSRSNRQLLATTTMFAQETRSNWTTADGSNTVTLYTAPAGWVINRIWSDRSSSYSYTDDDHSWDYHYPGSGELVQKFSVLGDTPNHDAGYATSVSVNFNPIELELREIGNCVQ